MVFKVLSLLSLYMYTSPLQSFGGYFLVVMASKLLAREPPHGKTLVATSLLVFLQLLTDGFPPTYPTFITGTKETLPLSLMFLSQKEWLPVLMALWFCTSHHSSSSKAVASFHPTQLKKNCFCLPSLSSCKDTYIFRQMH